MFQGEDHGGKDGDAYSKEEEQKANFLIALSDGHTQRLQTWAQMRTQKDFRPRSSFITMVSRFTAELLLILPQRCSRTKWACSVLSNPSNM